MRHILPLSSKRLWLTVAVALLLIILICTALSYLPVRRADMTHATVIVECRSGYALSIDGRDVLFFHGIAADSTFTDVSTDSTQAEHVSLSAGVWVDRWPVIPSCKGLLLTHTTVNDERKMAERVSQNLKLALEKEADALRKEEKACKHEAAELRYYLSVHGVQDEGFNAISKYAMKVSHRLDSVQRTLKAIESIKPDAKADVRQTLRFTVIMNDGKGKTFRKPCRLLTERDGRGFALLQTSDKTTPGTAHPVYMHRLMAWHGSKGDIVFIPSFSGMGRESFDPGTAESHISPALLKTDTGKEAAHTLPKLLAPDGSPVFSQGGHLLGVSHEGKVVSENEFGELFRNIK